MSHAGLGPECPPIDLLTAFAAETASTSQARFCEAHVAGCEYCQGEIASLRPVVDSLRCWPLDVLRPAASVWERLAVRIDPESPLPGATQVEASWLEVSDGIFCKVLSQDLGNDRLSMLVRLVPGAHYPPHEHADAEELHLLDGELWIDERRLVAGDYNRAEPGSVDTRVFSETGCTCVLVTSARDRLKS